MPKQTLSQLRREAMKLRKKSIAIKKVRIAQMKLRKEEMALKQEIKGLKMETSETAKYIATAKRTGGRAVGGVKKFVNDPRTRKSAKAVGKWLKKFGSTPG